jgi:hypothetical protein
MEPVQHHAASRKAVTRVPGIRRSPMVSDEPGQ